MGAKKGDRAVSTRDERWAGFDRAARAVFGTITGEDWRAMFRRHRAGERNPVADGISLFLHRPTGNSESGNVGKTGKDL
jgi:hypothetical protein